MSPIWLLPPWNVLEQTHKVQYQAAKKKKHDSDGGSYPAYPSGKTWDVPSGMIGSGEIAGGVHANNCLGGNSELH